MPKRQHSISINGEIHRRFRERCEAERSQMNKVVERLVVDYLDQNTAGVLQPPKTSAEVA